MAENRLEVTHLLGKKLDESIKIEWGTKTENKNKMEQVARMFGKKMHERFTIVRGGKKFDAVFSWMGLELMGEYENPYVELDAFVLMDLLNGEALIVNSEAEVEGAE